MSIGIDEGNCWWLQGGLGTEELNGLEHAGEGCCRKESRCSSFTLSSGKTEGDQTLRE